MRPVLHLTGNCEAAVAPYRFVKPGAADNGVVVGAAGTDLILGISNQTGGDLNDTVDYIVSGEAELELGAGGCTRGNRLTTDGTGKGITTVTAGHYLGAIALKSGVAGDIIPVLVIHGKQ